MEFKNKTALITGAGSGIGRAIAIMYAERGANVVVNDINEEGGNNTVEIIKNAGGEATFVRADVGIAEEVKALVKKTVSLYNQIDFACNNAAITGEVKDTHEYSIECWDKLIRNNLSSIFYGMKYEIEEMLKAGSGAIVNMGSIMSKFVYPQMIGYVTAKHGLIGATITAAREYAKRGIRVNAVGPGTIETPFTKVLPDEIIEIVRGTHPMNRLGKPEEVAELVLFLNSDKARFITGGFYAIDGGYLTGK